MSKPQQAPLDHHTDAKISQLRELLIAAPELDEVSDYFHNELVLDDAFIASGIRASNPRLLNALQVVLERVAPGSNLGTPLIIRLREQAFCHGYSTWGRGHVVFFYFEQLDLGFCSYVRSLSSAEVTFLRFNLANAVGASMVGVGPIVNAEAHRVAN